MKFTEEYRQSAEVKKLARRISAVARNRWNIMEICGGQTHAIMRFGLDQLLPQGINLVHGPGCPVCVTPVEIIDKAVEIARREEVIFCSFGDMLRVPGSEINLLSVKASGGDVRPVYSPLDALKIAESNQDKQVVFFAVGFETTAPATAMTVIQAEQKGRGNFFLLSAHVLVPPAVEAILSNPENLIDGFLLAGHVCAVTGYERYEPLAKKYSLPMVVTGFEPVDLLGGILRCVEQLEAGVSEVKNQYSRAVRREGNRAALDIIERVFSITDRNWRGMGKITASGLKLRDEYSDFDAERKFGRVIYGKERESECISGEILQGKKKPYECDAFAKECTPEHPLGATMVSSEGACAAYYKYRKV